MPASISTPPLRAARPPLPPALEAAATGALLRRGSRGPGVMELQRALNAQGFSLAVDGAFGPRTEAAVRAFQARARIAVDGVVGPQTVGALRAAQAGTTDGYQPGGGVTGPSGGGREQFDLYAAMVRRAGGEVCPGGRPTVLGLRTGVGGASTTYRDQFVVLTPDGQARVFTGATHPGQSRSSQSPDVTGDGVGDVGMIRPGTYHVVPNGPHAGAASFHVRSLEGSGRIAGWRDTDHDGTYSAAERASSERRGDTLTGVLFHQGNPHSPSSIGCQTMSPAEYARFLAAVGGAGASFSYTLVQV